jgi:hypothetical protein
LIFILDYKYCSGNSDSTNFASLWLGVRETRSIDYDKGTAELIVNVEIMKNPQKLCDWIMKEARKRAYADNTCHTTSFMVASLFLFFFLKQIWWLQNLQIVNYCDIYILYNIYLWALYYCYVQQIRLFNECLIFAKDNERVLKK